MFLSADPPALCMRDKKLVIARYLSISCIKSEVYSPFTFSFWLISALWDLIIC